MNLDYRGGDGAVGRCAVILLVCAITALLPFSRAAAQCPPPPPVSPLEAGEVGLFFDPMGTTTCADVPLGLFVPVYLVGRVAVGGVASYSITELLASPATVVTGGSLPAGAPFTVDFYADACNSAERIDPGICPAEEGELLVLAVYNVMFFTVTGTVCFQTACPTIAGTVPMNPHYTRCDAAGGGEFAGGESMCLGLGEEPVPVESSTWGKIKSLYGAN